jgi:hypothetical protein
MAHDKIKPEFYTQIVEYGRQGLGKAEVAAKFGVNRRTIYNWAADPVKYPEFCAAYEQYETELEAHHTNLLMRIASGEVKVTNGAVGALIYLCRVQLGTKHPEYLIDQKREIKTESVQSPDSVKNEIKRLIELAKDDNRKFRVVESGEFDSGATVKALPASKD